MKMPQSNSWSSLRNALRASGTASACSLFGVEATVPFGALVTGSVLGGRAQEFGGRSVLVLTSEQFTAALALIELDGVARRLVLCPAGFPPEHLPYVLEAAEVDAIVTDRPALVPGGLRPVTVFECSGQITSGTDFPSATCPTEWILLTSGTTGRPKLVAHTLASLAGAIVKPDANHSSDPCVWGTFYDIRRYGGLQVFLRSILTQTSLVLPGAGESTADFLVRAGSHGLTHLSGTPSHWRHALMSPAARCIAPRNLRLSGEIVDQAILNQLASFYPQASRTHVFASTEAGIAFGVHDGLAGFPPAVLQETSGVELKIEEGSLRIRSARTACCYLGEDAPALKGADGFVDTGDMVQLQDGRYCFAGRRDGVINVGGLKVHPEEVEAVLNRHPDVRMSRVRKKKNPITGAVVIADVVLSQTPQSASPDTQALQQNILQFCRQSLAAHKVPVLIQFVPALAVAGSGKMVRTDA
jgi:acyl-coenzyme A synthetase/AMP-(fatty) acid ligase